MPDHDDSWFKSKLKDLAKADKNKQDRANQVAREIDAVVDYLDTLSDEEFTAAMSRIATEFKDQIAKPAKSEEYMTAASVTPQPVPRQTSLPSPMADPPRRILCVGDEDQPTPEAQLVRAEVVDFLGCLFGLEEETEPGPGPTKASAPPPGDQQESVNAEIRDYVGDLLGLEQEP